MRIGVLGSGDVGRALARGFAGAGHNVRLGTRHPEAQEIKDWLKGDGKGVAVGSFAETARHGQVLVLAVLGTAAEAAIDLAGPGNFAGKLLIDSTNALDFSNSGPPGLFVGCTDSLGERIQRKVPEAKVVKCFNTVPNPQMVHPRFSGGLPEMLICGNDAAAKKETEAFLKSFGWPGAIDVGGIDGARWLEALVPLWVRVGAALNTWEHAFRVVRP